MERSAEPTPPTADGAGETAGFECNICFGLAQDAVITLCGHLHCWPCLYEWLRFHSRSHECPVCKAVIKEEELIPLYGRGNTHTTFDRRSVPRRPPGRRPATAPPPRRGGLIWRRRGFIPAAQGEIGVPTVQTVRLREVSDENEYGSFGEGGGNGEGGVVEEENIDDNLKKILLLLLVFVVFDFLII